MHQHSSAPPPIHFQKKKNNYTYLHPQNRYKFILVSTFLMQYVQIKISRLKIFIVDANKKVHMQLTPSGCKWRHHHVVRVLGT
jgi:hypothetical protein